VIIDFTHSRVTDYSSLEVIDNLAEKYIKEAPHAYIADDNKLA